MLELQKYDCNFDFSVLDCYLIQTTQEVFCHIPSEAAGKVRVLECKLKILIMSNV